jgi:capping protein (actin filament) muscle Z-line, beta
MEIETNTAFEVYRQMYYEGGTGSVYLWDLDEGFAGVVLLKKEDGKEAGWDSIHVFEVDESSASRGTTASSRTSHYKLTSTVILHLSNPSSSEISLSLAGSMTRQVEADLIPEPSGSLPGKDGGHVVNIGRLVEDMEGKMRNMLQEVYFGKAKDVVGDLRSLRPLGTVGEERTRHRELVGSMGK